MYARLVVRTHVRPPVLWLPFTNVRIIRSLSLRACGVHVHTRYYLGAEEGCVTCDMAVAPSVEYLIKSFPEWSSVHQMPVGEYDDDDADGVEDGDQAVVLSLCATLTELCRVGVLESRKPAGSK
jgi:hypothetical protein